jgi:transcriptional regulator with XRE-family HTH domain
MNSLTEQVGHRLRLARQAAGFKTARAFAQEHNIAQSTYSQYETGKRHFSVSVLAKLANCLKINPNWLILGKLPMFIEE